MPILYLLLVLAVFGFAVWLITTYIPMPEPIRKVIIVIAVIVLLVYLLNWAGAVKMPALK
jgi:hypothetical protein